MYSTYVKSVKKSLFVGPIPEFRYPWSNSLGLRRESSKFCVRRFAYPRSVFGTRKAVEPNSGYSWRDSRSVLWRPSRARGRPGPPPTGGRCNRRELDREGIPLNRVWSCAKSRVRIHQIRSPRPFAGLRGRSRLCRWTMDARGHWVTRLLSVEWNTTVIKRFVRGSSVPDPVSNPSSDW